jgi:hypothetical protein
MNGKRRKYLGVVMSASGLTILAALSGRIHAFFGLSQGQFLTATFLLLLVLFVSVTIVSEHQKY